MASGKIEQRARGLAFRGLHVLVCDDQELERDPSEQAHAACMGGAHVIQLRAKHASDRQIFDWALEIRDLTRRFGLRFVLNDRFDLALAAEADAVHLGQDDLPPAALPERVREKLCIGRSTHTPEQLEAARHEPIDYVAFGPVYGTHSKSSDYDARGLARLEEAVRAAQPRPLVAIGGIDESNLGPVLRAGAAGAAVISAVAGASNPGESTRRLARQFRDLPALEGDTPEGPAPESRREAPEAASE